MGFELDAYLNNKTFGSAKLTELKTYLNTLHLDDKSVEKVVFAVSAMFANKGMTNNIWPLITNRIEIGTAGTTIAYTIPSTGIGYIITALSGWNETQITAQMKMYLKPDGVLNSYEWLQYHAEAALKQSITSEPGRPDYPIFLPVGAIITASPITHTAADSKRLGIHYVEIV